MSGNYGYLVLACRVRQDNVIAAACTFFPRWLQLGDKAALNAPDEAVEAVAVDNGSPSNWSRRSCQL